jgi:hypothetical protein
MLFCVMSCPCLSCNAPLCLSPQSGCMLTMCCGVHHVMFFPCPQVVHTRYRPARLSKAWPKAAWFMAGHGRWGLKEASDSPLKVRAGRDRGPVSTGLS